jgi:hypothetical protein
MNPFGGLTSIYIIITNYNQENMIKMTTRPRHTKPKGFSTTCIDLRFVDEGHRYLQQEILGKDLYNTYALPGASLALRKIQDKEGNEQYIDHDFFTAWKKALEISIAVNNIKKIVIIDHEDCEYYERYYIIDNDFSKEFTKDYKDSTREEKYKMHGENMNTTIQQILNYLQTVSEYDNPEDQLKNLNPDRTYNGITIEGHLIKMDGKGEKLAGPIKIIRSDLGEPDSWEFSEKSGPDDSGIPPTYINLNEEFDKIETSINTKLVELDNKMKEDNGVNTGNMSEISSLFNNLNSRIDLLIAFINKNSSSIKTTSLDDLINILTNSIGSQERVLTFDDFENFNRNYNIYSDSIKNVLNEVKKILNPVSYN